LGFCFTFDAAGSITVLKQDLKDTNLAEELPLSFRIKDSLKSGQMMIKELTDVLDANEATIRTAINRLAKKGEVIKIGDAWGLAL